MPSSETSNSIKLSALGHKLPSLSTTRTLIKEMSLPSANNLSRSAVNSIRMGSEAVLIIFLKQLNHLHKLQLLIRLLGRVLPT